MGKECPNRGQLIRLFYAFSHGCYPLFRDHYRDRPTHLTDDPAKMEELMQWFFGNVPGVSYEKEPYFNMYHLLLWTMRQTI